MILLVAAMLQEPPPLSLDPFMDEKAAARSFEEHMACLGNGASKHRGDARDVGSVASEVVRSCEKNALRLRAALRAVYRRKPGLKPADTSAEAAADLYLTAMNRRIEFVIGEERNDRQHAQD
jgi:hypothetical protein